MSFEPQPLLDLLYDAALEPSLWSAALNRLADEVGGHGNVLTRINIWDGTGTSLSNRRDPVVMQDYFQHWSAHNPLHNVSSPEEYAKTWRPRILVDEELIDRDALTKTGFYNDWMRPNGMNAVMMIRLALERGHLSVLNISRPKNPGQYGVDDLRRASFYHSHLARAFSLTNRLDQDARSREELDTALEHVAASIFIIGADLRIRYCNPQAEKLLRQTKLLCIARGELRAQTTDADARLSALIRGASTQGDSTERGGTMRLACVSAPGGLSLTVAPVSASRASVFSAGPSVIVCATPLHGPAGDRLREAYGLTAAEYRLIAPLRAGLSLRETGNRLGITYNTARTHLARIFQKTQTGRQADLLRLVEGAKPSGADAPTD